MAAISVKLPEENHIGDRTNQIPTAGADEKVENFIEECYPNMKHEILSEIYPSWCDQSYRDFYEVEISNLSIDITKEMILQYLPFAEQKYTLVLESSSTNRTIKAILRFGPFCSPAVENYLTAKKIFGDDVKLMRIRTHPPSIKISGLPTGISAICFREEFPESFSMHASSIGLTQVLALEFQSFDLAATCWGRIKRSFPSDHWIADCNVVQNPEKIEENDIGGAD